MGQLEGASEREVAKLRERIQKSREREKDRTRAVPAGRSIRVLWSAVGAIARRNSSEIVRSSRRDFQKAWREFRYHVDGVERGSDEAGDVPETLSGRGSSLPKFASSQEGGNVSTSSTATSH